LSDISFLWYHVIGCLVVMATALIFNRIDVQKT
jgi:hypothetical protein